jgi:hypothetical protein
MALNGVTLSELFLLVFHLWELLFCAVSNTMFEIVLALFAQLRFLATDDPMHNYIAGV